MNTKTVLVVGFGDRARAYTKYALTHPDRLKVIGVVEPNDYRRNWAKEMFGLDEANCFTHIDEALARGKMCDAVINGTMDELHIPTALPFLAQGYDMLLEKPITNNREDLMKLKETADAHGCKLMICHVLRYTPFYKRIKEILLTNEIGEIFFIDTSEMVGVAHSSASYIRGKWNNRAKCGSSMLLAKCCHDLDLLCWMNSEAYPESVSCEGGRYFFIPEKAPKNSGTRCMVDCPLEKECPYSAAKLALGGNFFAQYLWVELDKPYEELTYEEKVEYLKTKSPFGQCIYKTDADIVDRQALVMKFSNGVVATHSMISGVSRPGRKIHIVGSKGEIDGFLEDNRFTVRLYNAENCLWTERVEEITGVEQNDGHSGGDSRLVEDFVKMLCGEEKSISATVIADSLNGHLCVYAADEAMEQGCVKKINPVHTK